MKAKIKILIEDYKRRLTFIKEINGDGNGSILDIKKSERLRTKASGYRTFIAELEKIESTPDKSSQVEQLTVTEDDILKNLFCDLNVSDFYWNDILPWFRDKYIVNLRNEQPCNCGCGCGEKQTEGKTAEETIRNILDEFVCCVRKKDNGGLTVKVSDRNMIVNQILNQFKTNK